MATTQLEAAADDAISMTLSKFQPDYLLTVIQGLKRVIDQDPVQGRTMLEANQDLTYAVLQAELLMGLVDESIVLEAMQIAQVSAEQANVQSTADAPAPAISVVPKPEPQPEPQSEAKKDPFEGLDPQQAEMIKQVIAIPEGQLSQLPAEQQEQVRSLKKQYLNI